MPVSSFQLRIGAGVLLLAGAAAWGQRAVDPAEKAGEYVPAKTAEELESRYAAVLQVMKNPEATGILVGELGPNSLGAGAGLRPGDLLVEYEGTKLDNRADADRVDVLRDAVSRAIALGQKPGVDLKVTIVLRRGGKSLVVRASRGALGIRALAVQAGVGVPANPPATERGSFALEWGESSGWFRVGDLAADFGAEKDDLTLVGKTATVTISGRSVDAAGKVVADAQAAGITMAVSDRTETYGVTLQRISYWDESVDVQARCRGGKVSGEITRKLTGNKQSVERPTVPEAVASLAVPNLAGALPLKDGVVMPLAIVSETDLQTRLGYALETRGLKTVKARGNDADVYAVRLWHLGQVEATYYFSKERELLLAEYEAGVGGVRLERATDEREAIQAMVPAGAGIPHTLPAPATVPATRAVEPARAVDPGVPGKDGR